MTDYETISRKKNHSENRKRKRSNYCYSDTEGFTTDSSNDSEGGLDNTQISQNQQFDKIYRCTVPNCNKLFTKKDYLTRHIAIHTNEKPFICNEPGCGKKFSLKCYLRKHRKRHSID